MITVYHNPRCSKSREALKWLDSKGEEYSIREYLKEPMTQDELEEVLDMLNIDAIDLIRNKEEIWKANFSGKDLDNNELILAMIEFPKLMERPIVVKDQKAVVARPADKISEIL